MDGFRTKTLVWMSGLRDLMVKGCISMIWLWRMKGFGLIQLMGHFSLTKYSRLLIFLIVMGDIIITFTTILIAKGLHILLI